MGRGVFQTNLDYTLDWKSVVIESNGGLLWRGLGRIIELIGTTGIPCLN
ncbi:hypothetical protein VDG1235_4430 [Verrucomicrobiia bacterium DG1235]|nr:hypothetical protein VDG1235_4430 [Verrucomicrobiae bacterium DG1235]